MKYRFSFNDVIDDKCAINSEQTNYNILGVENGAGEGLESDAQRYQEKLKMLQMRAGWDQHKKPGSAPSINAEQPSNLIPTLRITSPPQKLYRVGYINVRISKIS